MRLKTYRGGTIREAIARVRDSLGPEALIVSTTPFNGNGGKIGFEVAAMKGKDDRKDTHLTSVGDIKSELMSIKEMIYLLNHSSPITEALLMRPDPLNLYVRLIRSGIDNHYARMFLERACDREDDFSDKGSDIRERAINELRRVIEVSNPFNLRDGNRKIAAFIGTTGVGKTTTIAKLAARLVLTARMKVGLIMIDNYRIGAMAQLKTYADIIGIPCFPAFNRKDLLFAMERLKARDIILIDTAGLSHYDTHRMIELRDMIADCDPPIRSHLLLSVSTRSSEMVKAAANFSQFAFQSYIFTKMDEARHCGSIINQVLQHRAPISFITTGQNVPEDIEKANKERILARLLSKN
jgi:flagellar biosynthesis protein FlhF